MVVSSEAVSLIINPLAYIFVAMYMPESTLAVRFIETPITFVFGAISPDLLTMSVSILSFPLAQIFSAILESVDWLTDDVCRIIVHTSLQFLWGQRTWHTRHTDSLLALHLLPLHDWSRCSKLWHVGPYSISADPRLDPNDKLNVLLQVFKLFRR